MTDEQAFLQHILENPADWTARLVFADWLEEHGDPRSELLRLQYTLTQQINPPNRPALEAQQRELLASGVKPVGPFLTLPIAKGIGITFACIPPGTFLMGSPETEVGRSDDEELHEVTLTKPFFIGIHQVTQEQWQAITGDNPSHFKGENLPVNKYRGGLHGVLPRAIETDGTTMYFTIRSAMGICLPSGNDNTILFWQNDFDEVRRTLTAASTTTAKVRRVNTTRIQHRWAVLTANGLGLFDMHGNVWEWCLDWCAAETYKLGNGKIPHGPEERSTGCAGAVPGASTEGRRSAIRFGNAPCSRRSFLGFRVCLRLATSIFDALLPCYPLFFFDAQNAETVLTVDSIESKPPLMLVIGSWGFRCVYQALGYRECTRI